MSEITPGAAEYRLDINAITRFLPHRAPFLLVDRVLGIEPKGDIRRPVPAELLGIKVPRPRTVRELLTPEQFRAMERSLLHWRNWTVDRIALQLGDDYRSVSVAMRADHEAGAYDRWYIDHLFLMVPAQAYVAQHLATYKEFPPRQRPGSFTLDKVLEKLQEAGSKNE